MSPHSYPTTRLAYVTSTISDGTHGSYERVEEGVPLLSAKNVLDGQVRFGEGDSRVTGSDAEEIERSCSFRAGDVLVTIVGTIGRVALLDAKQRVVFQRSVASVRPSALVDGRYLQWALRSKPSQDGLLVRARQSAQAGVYLGDLADIPVAVPPMDAQRQIAHFLDDRVALIDQMVTARREQLQLLDELLTERVRCAVAGVLKAGEGSPCQDLPWVERIGSRAKPVALARVLTLQRGVDLTDEQRQPGHAQVITTAGVVGTHDAAVSPGPGVVIGRYGSVGSVHWVNGPFWPHNTTLYVKNTHGNDLKWIYYLLRSFPYAAMQARAAIPGINRNDLATELVPWIPRADQVKSVHWLDARVEADQVHRRQVRQSIELLGEYKQGLITAAVTGALDVATARNGIPG